MSSIKLYSVNLLYPLPIDILTINLKQKVY